jgi:ABC-type uncharacterized transport system substrate-binding protein
VTDRRRFLGTLAAGIIAAPSAARAQTATTVSRIGLLSPGAPITEAERQQIYAPFRELGWIDGENLLIERRYANGRPELLQPLAEELVRLKVELIATSGTGATLAAKRATTTIPIVIATAGDPVRSGRARDAQGVRADVPVAWPAADLHRGRRGGRIRERDRGDGAATSAGALGSSR